MANFPASLDSSGSTLPNPTGTSTQASPDHATLHTNENGAIIAIETKIGIGAATPVANRLLTGTGAGTSDWSKVSPTGVIVGTTDSQTLTNKTLTSPTITAPTITNATITADTVSGFSASTTGTIYGIAVSSGAITGASTVNGSALVANTVPAAAIINSSLTSTQLANAAVTPSKLSSASQQAFVATSETTTSTTYADLATTTDTVTVTVGSNGLALVSIYCGNVSNNTGSVRSYIGYAISGASTVAANDNLAIMLLTSAGNLPQAGFGATFLVTGLTAGSTTFKMKYRTESNTATYINRRISVVPL